MTLYRFTVKNTFIDIDDGEKSALPQPRCSSVPPSVRMCRDVNPEEFASVCDGKLTVPVPMPLSLHQSDASTDAHTEHSTTCSECGLSDVSPASNALEQQEPFSECYPCGSAATAGMQGPPGVFLQPVTALSPCVTASPAQRARLNSKASAYQPVQALAEPEDPAKENYKLCFAEVVNQAWQTVSDSEEVASAEVYENATGWTLTIKPHGADEWQTDSLMTFAKEALLEAAANSRNIYVMGYCAPKPFTMRAQGFQATLGAMENATAACWHYYKKGFCRHGDKCRTQHPDIQVPVQVLIESAHFNSYPRTVSDFKNEVAQLATTVSAKLADCKHAIHVETYKASDGQGWTVEVTPAEESNAHKEYLLTLAKSSLFSDSDSSNSVYIMGYAVKPFISKSDGFVTMVGNMRDASKACWDLYSKGMCTRDCLCKWEHPTCYMPIDVVIKPISTLCAR